jgi:hypothetical protein
MTIAMSEQVDAEPCDVLRGGDGPVYFLLGGQLYVVHEVLGRWIEADQAAAARPVSEPPVFDSPAFDSPAFDQEGSRNGGAGAGPAVPAPPEVTRPETARFEATRSESARSAPARSESAQSEPADRAQPGEPRMADPPMVEHWLVTASVGRFGHPAVFRLQRRPAPPAKGPDTWTVRAERR